MPTLDFDDLDAYESFFDARPSDRPVDTSPIGLARYREEILDWLVGAGLSQQGLEVDLCHEALAGREPVRLFVLLEDHNPGQASVVALVDSSLSETQREAFDRLGSACFEDLEHSARHGNLNAPIVACHTLRLTM